MMTRVAVQQRQRLFREGLGQLVEIGLITGDVSSADLTKGRRDGIRDVLPRSAGMSQILSALRATAPVLRLRPYPSTGTAQDAAGDPTNPVLTGRELTILNLVGAGFTSREISAQLAISHKTVENHKQRIFGTLGVQNQAHAVSVAMRRGVVRPDGVIDPFLAD
jgi:DNA-binding NarL/FixJ family response regulator